MIAKLRYRQLEGKSDKKLDYGFLFLLLALGGISLLSSEKLFIVALAGIVMVIISLDRFIYYKSAINLLLPFGLLIVIGLLSGLQNGKHDYFRDIIIFSRNIVYFISGVALSKYIKNFAQFFRYFLIVAFGASLVHVGKIVRHIGEINSLQTIRTTAGFTNSLEGIILAIFVCCLLSKGFKEVIGTLKPLQKMMLLFIGMSFFLYFSRTMLILLIVVCLFLTDSIYIRQIFSRKNRRLFIVAIFFGALLSILYVAALSFPANSPVHTLVQKFENVPDEVTWSKERNLTATREEIQTNWRGYEAYQGILKFDEGNTMQHMFGFGFGARVDLDLIMKLGGKEYEDVPILHNEYVMLLVKTGITGLLLYLLFLYMLGFQRVNSDGTDNREVYYSYQLISAMSVLMLINTFTGFGLLDPANQAIPVFMGFFWGNVQRNKLSLKFKQVKTADTRQLHGTKHDR